MDKILAFIGRKEVGLAIGLPFTALVVGLIIYGNFFASSSHQTNFEWEIRPDLYICDTAPKWVKPEHRSFKQAEEFWEEQGWAFRTVEVGPCNELCTVKTEDGKSIDVTCNRGKVTIDLMDKWWSEEHAGVCRYPSGKEVLQDNDWTTILVPNVILGSTEVDAPMLPPDAEALVLAHEIGHCLAGLGHNEGPSVGCGRLNSKTGAVMNPNLYNGGWVDEAIPESPMEWD
jgi:hypothetical protein